MHDRDYRDIGAGVGMTLLGAAAVLYATANYSLGTFTRMGPGMVPTALGAILAVFGLAIAIPAFFRRGAGVDLKLRVLVALGISILSFTLMIERFGIVPSVFTTTVIATFAENKVGPVRALILGAILSFITWAIFIAGLSLPIPAFDWPF